MTTPRQSSGISTHSDSKGSRVCPFSVLVMTVGRETSISKPSRRICSTRMAICIEPRAFRLKTPAVSVSETLMEMLDFISRKRRSRSWREVTYFPSRPASGPSLMQNCISIVGGSISEKGRAWAFSSAAMVSPMSMSSKPERPTMLPATPAADSLVSMPENSTTLVILQRTRSPPLLRMT